MTTEAGQPRLLGSLRALAASLIGLAGTRLQLASVELAEEKIRLLSLLAKMLAAVVFCGLGVLVLSFLVVAYYWESHRWAALLGLALAYGALGGWLAWSARRALATHPPLFEATTAELEKDRLQFQRAFGREDA